MGTLFEILEEDEELPTPMVGHVAQAVALSATGFRPTDEVQYPIPSHLAMAH